VNITPLGLALSELPHLEWPKMIGFPSLSGGITKNFLVEKEVIIENNSYIEKKIIYEKFSIICFRSNPSFGGHVGWF
jgi:hypothetical protein